MTQVVIELAKNLNSSVFILLLVLGIVFWAVFKIGKWSETFAIHSKRIESSEQNTERLIKVETKIDLIYQNTMRTPIIQSHSPMSLTKVGNDIIVSIGASQLFEKYKEKLSKIVNADTSKNAYDIQMLSMKVARESMVNLLNADELILVKDEAFQRGVLLEDIMSVFGILLRDSILAERGLPIADVDRHAPKT